MAITSLHITEHGAVAGHKRLPRLRKRYVIAVLLVILVIVLIVVAYFTGVFDKTKKEILVPPNPTSQLPPSPSILRNFKRAAVCADGAPCAEIGKQILEKNGSAVDAALAAMFCNGVVNMQSMGIGGGFLMTIYIRDEKKSYTLNAREKAPLNASSEMYKDNPDKSKNGPLAIAVPGELKGYKEAHQKFGKLPWKTIMEPTIELCENGYLVNNHQHASYSKNNLNNDTNFMEWFKDKNGNFKKEGDRIIPKKLCGTLKQIAEKGADDFYTGELSKILVEDIEELGGIITAEDFKQYTAEWKDPVMVNLRNDILYSVPPPGSGLLLGFILNILDGYNFDRESINGIDNTITTYHRMIEAFKYAFAKRTELGDTNFVNTTDLIKNLTSNEYADSIRLKIKDNSTSTNPKDYGAVYYSKDDHGTAHISVLAENGDAVSVTSSINIYFGAGLTSRRTGVIFNSVMDDFSYPYFKNYFGLPGSPNNEMVPGKRPLSSMSPSIIVDKNGDVKLVVGASGGTKISTAVAQVIMRMLWFEQNVKEAVDASRIHHQLYPMEVEYEYGTLQQIVDGLEALGHKTKRSAAGSVICSIVKLAQGILANADHRKGGDVYGLM